ncbi:hypothetical protein KJ612_03175, partial [Myxococcota bacterium]|nr:hypothetical protein [Myxococcota bacterium]
GSLNDSIEWASSMPDGGFILGGVTSSMDVPGLPPPEDGTFPNGFVVRLDADGGIVWQAQPGSMGYDDARAVVGRPDGSALTAGRFLRSTMVCPELEDGCPGAGVLLIPYDADDTAGPQKVLAGGGGDTRPFVALIQSGGVPTLVTRLMTDWFGGGAAGLVAPSYSGVFVWRLNSTSF